ncbi:MAG TPA: transcription elongation factor [Vicinamibacteria bacterium]|jgi:hypothetical protein
MPSKKTRTRAKKAMKEGKSPSTAAGEYVHEEIEHIRKGKHGARSTKQAIAIGLSKARRAGVPLKPPRRGTTSARTRKSAARAYAAGRRKRRTTPSKKRSTAMLRRLKREPRSVVSRKALSAHARRTTRAREATRAANRRRARRS